MSLFIPLKGPADAASSHQLSALETQCGFLIPEDYRRFLATVGRSYFDGDAFIRCEDGKRRLIDTMHGLAEILRDYEFNPDYIQARLIPIGSDLFSNRFAIHPSGAVVFIEYVDEKCVVCAPVTYPVASSFSDMVARIEIEPC